jgi:N-acetylglutamate synthase-like GNAT family acetyltransferase
VDKLLYALTVGVHPAYRGRGVANHMFKTRGILVKELGLKVTTTHTTATGSQKAAKNAGFEENFVVS